MKVGFIGLGHMGAGKAGIDRRQNLDILTSTLFDVPVY